MEFLNFTLDGQNIGLEWSNGGYADLHNSFKFVDLQYAPAAATLRLRWQKSTGDWAKNVPWQGLHLVFEGVTYFRVKERDPDFPISEDDCLRDICCTPSEMRDDFDNCYTGRNWPAEYDLQLVFQSEWGIKVNAVTVRLQLES
ncbi:hypothetical protein [Hymenobacter metallicola]|uniref:Uncharacterized protein n=1 Tax=Hymenobacter metallicola TaxID=2563114 RepID=A0A4Z0QHQ9_9BACT|nr:hypothetical protein [Hymenobacter metallicola]TGE29016.1 hypothetical protein E5K02_06045 [Hymenobacter metallicola]